MATFGEKIRTVRESKRMTQDDLAELLRSTKQVISNYENEKRVPKITVAKDIAEVLGVSVVYLCDDKIPASAFGVTPVFGNPSSTNDDPQTSGRLEALTALFNKMDSQAQVEFLNAGDRIYCGSHYDSSACDPSFLSKFGMLDEVDRAKIIERMDVLLESEKYQASTAKSKNA